MITVGEKTGKVRKGVQGGGEKIEGNPNFMGPSLDQGPSKDL